MAANIPHHSDTRSRALEYLSIGISAAQTAKALGVSESTISQLMGEEEFIQQLADKKFEKNRKVVTQDDNLDELQSRATDQLLQSLGTVYDPMKLARILQVAGSIKRRSTPVTASNDSPTKVVELHLPPALVSRFVLNQHNQVLVAGSQNLVTIQSAEVSSLATKIVGPINSSHGGIDETHNLTLNESDERNGNSSRRESAGEIRASDQKLSLPVPTKPNILEHGLSYTKTDEYGFEYENQKI